MKAIVHIGAGKTNASAIQQYLHLNRKNLQKAGYHFVQSTTYLGGHALPAYCAGEAKLDDYLRAQGITTQEKKNEANQKFISDFEAELSGLPATVHTVLISSEHLQSRIETAADMDNLKQLLSGYFDEFKIVCYLREQVTTCTREYSTFLKCGGVLSFEKFLRKCGPGSASHNYWEMLESWERCFGEKALDVSLYSKNHFLNGNLLDDFTAKIDPGLVGKLKQGVLVESESLRPAGQVLLRMVNVVFPLRSKLPEIVSFRAKCQKLIVQRMSGRGQQPELEAWQASYRRFAASNEKVRQKFFPGVENLFAAPFEIDMARSIVDDEFTEVLFEIVGLVKESSIDIQQPKVYSRLWGVISTCVNDVVPLQGVSLGDKPASASLDDKDVHLLKDIAIRFEKTNPQAALKLMTLAFKVKPNSIIIQKKMEEYCKTTGGKQKSQFIVTYYGGEESADQRENKEWNARYGRWLKSLDIPAGSTLIPIKDRKVFSADSMGSDGKSSSMMGFTIFRAKSLEEALTIARECPLLETGGTIELSEVSTQ